MSKHARTFRIDLWPEAVIPLPTDGFAERRWLHEVRQDGASIVATVGKPYPRDPIPDEWYLRDVRNLDLADAEAITAFVQQFGSLRPRWRDSAGRVPYLSELLSDQGIWLENLALHDDYLRSVDTEASDERARVSRAGGVQLVVCTLSEFRLAVNWLLDLTDIAEAYLLADPEALGAGPSQWRSGRFIDRPADDWESTAVLAGGLDAGLGPLRVHSWVEVSAMENEYDRQKFARLELYNIACLQLRNHLAERVRYRHCPRCGAMFVRQQGRSVKGQQRTEGVTYCSARCAKAVAQQKWRESRREADR